MSVKPKPTKAMNVATLVHGCLPLRGTMTTPRRVVSTMTIEYRRFGHEGTVTYHDAKCEKVSD